MITIENSIDTPQKTPSRVKSISQWIWASILLISAVLFFSSTMRIQRFWSSSTWPTVTGVIETSELNYTPLSRTALKYQLQLAYGYAVNGIRYQSDKISFAQKTSFIGRTSSERFVKRVLADYPKGAVVTVHYHTSHPELAVLEVDIPKRTIKLLLFGLGMTILSFIGLWRRWSLQSDYLFKPYYPDAPMTAQKLILGAMGLAVCLGIAWIWWELIKKYAGR